MPMHIIRIQNIPIHAHSRRRQKHFTIEEQKSIAMVCSLWTVFISRRQLFGFAKIIHVGFSHSTLYTHTVFFIVRHSSNITAANAVNKYWQSEKGSPCIKKMWWSSLKNEIKHLNLFDFHSWWKIVQRNQWWIVKCTPFPHSSLHHSHRTRSLITMYIVHSTHTHWKKDA